MSSVTASNIMYYAMGPDHLKTESCGQRTKLKTKTETESNTPLTTHANAESQKQPSISNSKLH